MHGRPLLEGRLPNYDLVRKLSQIWYDSHSLARGVGTAMVSLSRGLCTIARTAQSLTTTATTLFASIWQVNLCVNLPAQDLSYSSRDWLTGGNTTDGVFLQMW
jgi:hypothetical protein